LSIKELEWLKEYIYLGKLEHDESLLRVAIVNEEDEIKGLMGGVALEKYKLFYNAHLGYQAMKAGTIK